MPRSSPDTIEDEAEVPTFGTSAFQSERWTPARFRPADLPEPGFRPGASQMAGRALWRLFRKVGSATVVHVDLTPDRSRELLALPWLDEAELARWQRFVHPRPQRQFTLCRAVLRELLCHRLGCGNNRLAFATGTYGKPFALVGGSPAPIAFNVSHGGRHGLIALAPAGRIGVDVEERAARRDMDEDIRLLFAPGERARLQTVCGLRKVDLFYRLWTMKEALVKASGAGLSVDTTGFEIPFAIYAGAGSGLFNFPGAPDETWRLEKLGNANFEAALAIEAVPLAD